MRSFAVVVALSLVGAAVAQTPPEGPEVQPKLALNFGTEAGEEALSSFARDKDGAFWVAGMSKSLVDKFTYDWFVARLSADGKPQWMRVYGSKFEDSTVRHIDMAGEGIPRMLALCPDGSGAIVVGRSEAGPEGKSPHAAVVFKVSPDGALVWSKAFRPGWENKMIQSAGATGVVVVGDRAYVVGVTSAESQAMLAVFDAGTGEMKSVQGFDMAPGSNDRFFALAADEQNKALWVGGWSAKGNKAVVGKLTLEDKPTLTFMKRIPNGWASTVPDIALDADGNAYLASEVHGATTWVEAWKIAPDGAVVWRAKYDTGSRIDRQNTHAIAVHGDKVIILGRISYSGTQTHSDTIQGDSLVLVLDRDGKKLFDMYHFTGTHKLLMSMERARGCALDGDTFWVAGNIWSDGAQYAGQWRKPDDYKLPCAVALDTPAAEDAEVKLEDQSASAPRDPSWLEWTDTTDKLTVGSPSEMSKTQRSTQCWIFAFENPF